MLRLEEADSPAKALVGAIEGGSPGGAGGGEGGQPMTRKEKQAARRAAKKAAAAEVNAVAGGESEKKACFEMRDKGSCSRGDACRFAHDAATIAAAKKAKKNITNCLNLLRCRCTFSQYRDEGARRMDLDDKDKGAN